MGSGLDDLYRDIILDHYRSPRNRGRLPEPDVATQGANPLCGDEIEVSLVVRDGKVAGVSFDGKGCSISQASASMMTEAVLGKDLAQVAETIGLFKQLMRGEIDPEVDENAEALGDIEALQGVRRYPVRIKCALLAWNTLEEALELRAKAMSGRSASSGAPTIALDGHSHKMP